MDKWRHLRLQFSFLRILVGEGSRERAREVGKVFRLLRDVPSWRRIALHIWDTPRDPSVYGTLDIVADRAEAYLARVRQQSGAHVTFTHLVAKGLGMVIRLCPQVNGIVSRRRIYVRDTVDIFVQVVTDAGEDLSGAKIACIDQKELADIARELEEKTRRVREHRDPQTERTKRLVSRLPNALIGPAIKILSFLNYDLRIDLSPLGIANDQFGCAMVSNVGSFGLSWGLAPLVPVSRAPIVVLVGEVKPKPVVVGDKVVPRPVLTLGCTFDHRFIDGYHAGVMAAALQAILANPEEHLGQAPADLVAVAGGPRGR